MEILGIVFISLGGFFFLFFTIVTFGYSEYKNLSMGSLILMIIFLSFGLIIFMASSTSDCRDQRNEIDRILESDTEFLVTDDFIFYVLECVD